jgi:hypothetical protein
MRSGSRTGASGVDGDGEGAEVKLEAEEKKPAGIPGSPPRIGDAGQSRSKSQEKSGSKSKDLSKSKSKDKDQGKGKGKTVVDEVRADGKKRALEVSPVQVKRIKTEFKSNTASQSQRSSQKSSPHPGPPGSGTGGTSGSATPDTGLERESRENGGIVDLDAREREIRAQKKREKKARRKARKEGEGEGEA